ncbi:MAG: hypothetical protein NVS3B18_10370 [Candidatus Dormibacteria bacterium]
MASDDIKSAITGWCTSEDSLQFVEDLTDSGCDFALGLRAGTPETATVSVEVLLETGADRLTVRSTSAGASGSVEEVLACRPASVTAASGQSGATVVTGYVYLDGFNKHSFIQIVSEVARTASLLSRVDAASTASPATTGYTAEPAAATPAYTPEPAAAAAATPTEAWSPQPVQASSLPHQDTQPVTPVGQTLPAPSFGGGVPAQGQGGYGYSPLSGQPAPQPLPTPQPAAFGPTHTVPPQGLQAWAAPDPNGAVVATLGGGLPIQVTEVRGAWARVLCSNGWTGWVDGRIIGVAR